MAHIILSVVARERNLGVQNNFISFSHNSSDPGYWPPYGFSLGKVLFLEIRGRANAAFSYPHILLVTVAG